MEYNPLKTDHEILTDCLGPDFTTEFNPTEHDHPETLVTVEHTPDRNVEVIYHSGGDVILLQENGAEIENPRQSYVWRAAPGGWDREVAEIIKLWLW